ncbi:MAG: hypothetical protein ACYTFI_13810 [Planctomycetota bacterium]
MTDDEAVSGRFLVIKEGEPISEKDGHFFFRRGDVAALEEVLDEGIVTLSEFERLRRRVLRDNVALSIIVGDDDGNVVEDLTYGPPADDDA